MTVRAWMRPGSISCVQAATYQAFLTQPDVETGDCMEKG